MGFEVFVQCLERDGPTGIPRSAVRSLFPVDERQSERDYWAVTYDDVNSCHIGVSPLASDPTLLESLCVYRPCGDPRLWEALLTVLRLGPAVLFFPGNAPPLVASPAVAEQVPADMVEGMGRPRVVSSGGEIVEIMKHA
ncbi:MAG TPA: hypothetical protein VJR24_02460 [Gemmatimonadaceae bacterium]|nr:hypothetical protein [Gemmatimonadaceae bacterium]